MKSFKGGVVLGRAAKREGEGETFTQEQLDTAIAAAVTKANDESSSSLGAKNKELLADLRKSKDTLKQFDGIDPDKFKSMMKAFDDNQDLKDIADGKHEEVINRRIEKERVGFTSQLTALEERATSSENERNSLQARVSKLLIDNNVVSEFVKEKGLESGIEDVVLRANQLFKVEGDDLIPRDSKGEIIAGKNGAMTITEWVGGLKEAAPHLFPGSSGSGAQGGEGGSTSSGIEKQIQEAASKGDMVGYRRLRKEQQEAK